MAETPLYLQPNLRLQIVSDLHLDTRRSYEFYITPKAPILAILGDVASVAHPSYKKFLTESSASFEQVLVVPKRSEEFSR